jgi:hypothetical protein
MNSNLSVSRFSCEDEKLIKNKCNQNYGVTHKFMDSWEETMEILDKYGIVNMNHIWNGHTLNYFLWSYTPENHKGKVPSVGEVLFEMCNPKDHRIGEFDEHFCDMLDSKLGDQWFLDLGFTQQDILLIHTAVHREAFVLNQAINWICPSNMDKWEDTKLPFVIGKVFSYCEVEPRRKNKITELINLYQTRKHPLIAIILFSQFTLRELVCIGI